MSESVPFTDQQAERDVAVHDELEERIRRRAYEISQSDESGSDEENWRRAEREIREETGAR
jgi:post-segregation antitoxin (ccd killing protein)